MVSLLSASAVMPPTQRLAPAVSSLVKVCLWSLLAAPLTHAHGLAAPGLSSCSLSVIRLLLLPRRITSVEPGLMIRATLPRTPSGLVSRDGVVQVARPRDEDAEVVDGEVEIRFGLVTHGTP